MKFCCWERRKLYSLSDLRKSVSSINEVFYSISWAHKLAGVYNPCTSEFVLSVKEGVIINSCFTFFNVQINMIRIKLYVRTFEFTNSENLKKPA
jgi:hypothetical protein